MDCFETEACVSGMGHLVVVATHPVMLCFPGQSHLKSESSYQHGTVNKCSVFQGREKKKKKKGKKKKKQLSQLLQVWERNSWKALLFRSLSGLWGDFYRVCMPAQDLLLSDREKEKLPEAVRWGTT